MAEILYAQGLDISDDRIKRASIVEPTFTQQAYFESAAFVSRDVGVQIGDKITDLKKAFENGKITMEQYEESVSELREMEDAELAQREAEAAALKVDGATEDLKAVGEIIEEVTIIRREEKAESKYYAVNYFDHIVRAVKMRLIVRDESVSKEREKKLDEITQAVKELNDAFITKYANTKTFADRMLSISGSAEAKKLAAPVEQAVSFKYEGL